MSDEKQAPLSLQVMESEKMLEHLRHIVADLNGKHLHAVGQAGEWRARRRTAPIFCDEQAARWDAEATWATEKKAALEQAIFRLEVETHPGYRGCERVENYRLPTGIAWVWWFVNIQGSPKTVYGHGGPTLEAALLKAHETLYPSTPQDKKGEDTQS